MTKAHILVITCGFLLALFSAYILTLMELGRGQTILPPSQSQPQPLATAARGGYALAPVFGGDSGGKCPDNSFRVDRYKKTRSCNSLECSELCTHVMLDEAHCTLTGICCCGLRASSGGLNLMGVSTTTLLVVLLGSFVLLHDFLSS